jgi:hypothetical protein
MEWELSKENVQPLRKGRKVEVLNEALRAKEESPARSKICESERRFNHSPSPSTLTEFNTLSILVFCQKSSLMHLEYYS